MKRTLSIAISLALTLAAGCSTQAPSSSTATGDARKQEAGREENDVALIFAEPPAAPAEPQAAASSDASGARSAPMRHPPLSKRRGSEGRALAPASIAPPAPMPPPMPVMAAEIAAVADVPGTQAPSLDGETYADLESNPTQRVAEQPVSTFSIDVDSGSYANVRRMLVAGSLPPADAVRAEEMINYFDFGYAPPTSTATPFSVTTELSIAPWNPQRQLLLVGIKGFEIAPDKIPASNLVFLIDTSGSMQSPDKIDLLKQAFAQLVDTLRPQDRVAIVTYAGSAGLVLPSTTGKNKAQILAALEQLDAGGSTNGGAGIELAYAAAQQHFTEGGVNRVILATDGDFNVGITDIQALEALVENRRDSGIALTTLGFGTGNYNDQIAERLADIGNGNHAYIDTLSEARKVLVDELSSTMLTIAKDVKIQIEFNPAVVAEYRLIGYENRQLRREDFNNDRIDAGEIGAGHDVTALYELALVGSGAESLDPLRYATSNGDATATKRAPHPADELALLKLRYKAPASDTSQLIERTIAASSATTQPSERLRFAASVAAFADAMRGGKHLARWNLDDVISLAQGARGDDTDGLRGEFVALVEQLRTLKGGDTSIAIAR